MRIWFNCRFLVSEFICVFDLNVGTYSLWNYTCIWFNCRYLVSIILLHCITKQAELKNIILPKKWSWLLQNFHIKQCPISYRTNSLSLWVSYYCCVQANKLKYWTTGTRNNLNGSITGFQSIKNFGPRNPSFKQMLVYSNCAKQIDINNFNWYKQVVGLASSNHNALF